MEGHRNVDAGVNYQHVVVGGVRLGGLVFVHFMLFALAVSVSPEESVTKRRDTGLWTDNMMMIS